MRNLPSFKALSTHYEEIRDTEMRAMFEDDKNRFDFFSVKFGDFLLDYSKNRIDERAIKLLTRLAVESGVGDMIEKMFSGERINSTENRAALHIALRDKSKSPILVDGEDVKPAIAAVKARMKHFVNKVTTGEWKGFSGNVITDVVNIGIGGSDLGPKMVTAALKPFHSDEIKVHFISNVDSAAINETLKALNPATTLFLIASKTFTTQETLTNAHTARTWFLKDARTSEKDIALHFAALSTNEKGVTAFGIDPENMFEFWDWVGGRYSLWSAIGMPIAMQIGWDNFEELLAGAYEMDVHFKETDFERNLPVLLALLGIWYQNFFGVKSQAIIPYSEYLSLLPDFLQQLDMESNGKSTTRKGEQVDYSTGAIVWGKAGTDCQHSFFQLIHQGTQLIPADFIGFVNSHNENGQHHEILLSNLFAQTEALMRGKTVEEVDRELKNQALSEEEIRQIRPHKVFSGNRPTNTLLIKKLSPRNIGSLLALYEHKVFVQGVIWNINSFDQWGVELGKQLAKAILPELADDKPVFSHDSSTNSLINYYKRNRLEK